MRLRDWAEREGIHYQTAWTWVCDGKMPVPFSRTPTGTILVDVPERTVPGRTVVYARVSSHDQRADLERQVARLVEWATTQRLAVEEVITEVGSGMNGKRRRFARVLADPTATTIVVEHRDRLARFGVEYLEAALMAQGRRIMVTDPGETTDDLVRDMTEVLTSFCARLYGRRGAANRAEKALRCARADVGPMTLHQDPEASA
jgi:putative resolvase